MRPTLCMLLAAMALLVQEVPAAASSQPGAPCSNPTVSAVNQYCENVPSASGGHLVGLGTPVVGSRLPPRIVNLIRGTPGGGASGSTTAPSGRGGGSGGTAGGPPAAGSAQARQALLTLPAPTPPRAPLGESPPSSPNSWSLFSGLIIVLVIATAALSIVALARRWRTSGGA